MLKSQYIDQPFSFHSIQASCSVSCARLSAMERSAVAVLHHLGIDHDLIVLFVQRDPRTIAAWIERFAQDWGVADERSGRSHTLSTDENNDIVRLSKEHPFMVPKDLKHMLTFDVSARTVRRILDEAGLCEKD